MFSGNEWLIVVIIALVLFGGSQLPKLARSLGEAQKELKKSMKDDDDTPAKKPATDSASDSA
ncbi:MAG: twin-arginine translocase TatA/TatE family subunit [Microthrixaceae bacterium]